MFVLSNITIAAREAAAPNSNPIAKAQFIKPSCAKSKKATELIIEIVATKKYKLTNIPIIDKCTNFSFKVFILYFYITPVTNPPDPHPESPPFFAILDSSIVATHRQGIPYTSSNPVGKAPVGPTPVGVPVSG